MKKVLFVGSQNLGHTPDDGETMKNQLMREALSPYFDIIPIDLRKQAKRVLYLFKFVVYAFFCRKTTIIISASAFVAYKLIRVLYYLGRKNNVFYWVVGGLFDKLLIRGKFNVKYYKGLEMVIVQGRTLEENVRKCGLERVLTVPNSKKIDYYPKHIVSGNQAKRFVFLSRIIAEKGVEELVNVVKNINQKYPTSFILDLWGRLDKEYEDKLKSIIDGVANVEYKGLLDLTKKEGYDILSSYDIMVFPTYYPGEGFPGVIIDAYIAGLPVIASDWHENPNVVQNNIDGIIFPTHDIQELEKIMIGAIDGRYDIFTMSNNSRLQARMYDTRMVINKELLTQIGLI